MPQINGANGTWDYKIYELNGHDYIDMTFTPKPGTACKKIRILQVCKPFAYGADGKEIPGPPEKWYLDDDPPLYRPTAPDRVTDKEGRVHYLDHRSCDKEPYLDEVDADKMTGGATKASDGAFVVFKGVIKDKVKKIVKVFTTAAVCVETGEILGCFSWSMTSTRDKEGKFKVDPPDKEVTADETFQAAIKEFVKNHTRKKYDGTGKIYWWCPEKLDDPKASRYGEEVPEGFAKKWIASELPALRLDSKAAIGGGVRFPSAAVAFRACREDPYRAAIKFTWSGEQEKTIAGVIFAAMPVTPDDIAPHVDAHRRFDNDFLGLRIYEIPATALAQFIIHLQGSKTSRDAPTAVTLIAGLGKESPASYTQLFSRDAISAFVRRASVPIADLGEEAAAAYGLKYLGLNLGTGPNAALGTRRQGSQRRSKRA